jgi:hypothetical protein
MLSPWDEDSLRPRGFDQVDQVSPGLQDSRRDLLQMSKLQRHFVPATISLSLQDKSHSTIQGLRIKLALMGNPKLLSHSHTQPFNTK